MYQNILYQYAASYDCNAYGSESYDSAQCSTQTSEPSGLIDSALAYTGSSAFLGVCVALLIIAVSVALFMKHLRKS